jgi:hypothetical protein
VHFFLLSLYHLKKTSLSFFHILFFFISYFLRVGNLGTYQERAKARELTDNDIKVLLSLELPQGQAILGGILGDGGKGGNGISANNKTKKSDDVDKGIPKVRKKRKNIVLFITYKQYKIKYCTYLILFGVMG